MSQTVKIIIKDIPDEIIRGCQKSINRMGIGDVCNLNEIVVDFTMQAFEQILKTLAEYSALKYFQNKPSDDIEKIINNN